MTDTERQARDIDLAGVDVIVALYNCEVPADCEAGKVEWTKALAAKGASVEFLGWEATNDEALVRILGKAGP